MSGVYIQGLLKNIRGKLSSYSPVVEVIVNGIQAIEELPSTNGRVIVETIRDSGLSLKDNSENETIKPEITGFRVTDNGIGFTEANRKAFDEAYTDRRAELGGKGFGRFVCLKFFKDVEIESVYQRDGEWRRRSFIMGKERNIIEREEDIESSETSSQTTVKLVELQQGTDYGTDLKLVAQNLVDRLLPYFISDGYECPRIILKDAGSSDEILLNDFEENCGSNSIREIGTRQHFELPGNEGSETFYVRTFQVYRGGNHKSRISFVAHKREVRVESLLENLIPEFSVGFTDEDRFFYVKAYVFSPYFDKHVSVERGTIEFPDDGDVTGGITQAQIEKKVAPIAKNALGSAITNRQDETAKRVRRYVNTNAPWHKPYVDSIDLKDLKYRPSDSDIEMYLQRERMTDELQTRREVDKILQTSKFEDLETNVEKIVEKIGVGSSSQLIHYVAERKAILELLQKSLAFSHSGDYEREGVLHDLVLPRKTDSQSLMFKNHNLWVIDERLNFSEYVASDLPINKDTNDRPDIVAYGKRVVFRLGNDSSNPVMIVEFKRPGETDFINPSSYQSDPVNQVTRYANKIKTSGEVDKVGTQINVGPNTPFHAYIVCTMSSPVKDWFVTTKNFMELPDGDGFFYFHSAARMHIEAISWEKMIGDATMRHEAFFNKLGV